MQKLKPASKTGRLCYASFNGNSAIVIKSTPAVRRRNLLNFLAGSHEKKTMIIIVITRTEEAERTKVMRSVPLRSSKHAHSISPEGHASSL